MKLQKRIYNTLKTSSKQWDNPFAKAAVDIAIHDLCGKNIRQPLTYTVRRKTTRDALPLCYALSIDSPEIMALKAKALQPLFML